MRDVGLREAAEHGGVQHLSGVLGLVGHAHQRLHRLARRRVNERAAHDRAIAPHHLRLDLARQHAQQGASGAARGIGHVDVRIGTVAGDDIGAVDHGVRHLRVEIEGDGNRHVGRDLADAVQQLAFAVVIFLRDHRAMQSQQDRVAALPDLLDDGGGHLFVRGLGDQAGRIGRGRHRYSKLGASLAGDLDEAAQGGIGPFGSRDGFGAGQIARAGEGIDGRGERRERVRLMHHHCDYELLRHGIFPQTTKSLDRL